MTRSLPGAVVDKIRDGAGEADLKRRGDAAVWGVLVSTAASAVQRGWSRTDWAAVVTHPGSVLGTQAARRYDDWPPKNRSRTDTERLLLRAWEVAEDWVKAAPPAYTRDQAIVRVTAIERAATGAILHDTDRAVLAFAIATARRIGTDRPALPRRAIVEATGLGERTIRNAITRLTGAGWLTVEEHGTPGPNARRANLYRLSTPAAAQGTPIPGGRGMRDRSVICGTPLPDGSEDDPERFDNVIPFPRRSA